MNERLETVKTWAKEHKPLVVIIGIFLLLLLFSQF